MKLPAWVMPTLLVASLAANAFFAARHLKRTTSPANDPDTYFVGAESVYAGANVQNAQVVFAGDSIAERCPWSEYLGQPVMTRGIAGEPSTQLLKRLSELASHSPKVLIVLTGANDLKGKVPPDQIVKNLRAIATAHVAPTVLILGILPARADILPPAAVKQVDDALAANAQSWGAVYVAPPVGYTAEADTFDGLHPNGAGYKLIAAEITRHLPRSPLTPSSRDIPDRIKPNKPGL